MLLNVIFAALTALTTLLLAYLGLKATIRPPKKSDDRGRRRLQKGFWSVGAISLLLTIMATVQNDMVTNRLLKSQDGSVRLIDTYLADRPVKFVPGLAITVASRYRAVGDISAVRSRHLVEIANGPSTREQQQVEYDTVRDQLTRRIDETGTDEKGQSFWGVMAQSEAVPEEDIQAILTGDKTLYSFGYVEWRNPSGSRSSTFMCRYLVPSTITGSDEVWADCSIKTGE